MTYVNKYLLPLITSPLTYVVYKIVFYTKVTVGYYEQELKSDQLVCIFLCMGNAQSFQCLLFKVSRSGETGCLTY